MTGREWIIYIMTHGLEDEEMFKDGKLLGFINEREAASKFDVGIETVRIWIKMGMLKGVQIGSEYYIPANINDPREVVCSK